MSFRCGGLDNFRRRALACAWQAHLGCLSVAALGLVVTFAFDAFALAVFVVALAAGLLAFAALVVALAARLGVACSLDVARSFLVAAALLVARSFLVAAAFCVAFRFFVAARLCVASRLFMACWLALRRGRMLSRFGALGRRGTVSGGRRALGGCGFLRRCRTLRGRARLGGRCLLCSCTRSRCRLARLSCGCRGARRGGSCGWTSLSSRRWTRLRGGCDLGCAGRTVGRGRCAVNDHVQSHVFGRRRRHKKSDNDDTD